MGYENCGFSEIECKIIKAQVQRRKEMREKFLKLRSDPSNHAKEAGYVFDDALQRFMSMKVSTLDFFEPNMKTISFAFIIFAPMGLFGYLIWKQRTAREQEIRCGRLKYKDRLHKFQ